MGGHGGLNILPQKKWNVYNPDNREKVRKDEEKHAAEEAGKKSRQQLAEAEFRLNQLRKRNGITIPPSNSVGSPDHEDHVFSLKPASKKSLATNPEYEREKRELEDRDERMVTMYLGAGSNELSKVKPFYMQSRSPLDIPTFTVKSFVPSSTFTSSTASSSTAADSAIFEAQRDHKAQLDPMALGVSMQQQQLQRQQARELAEQKAIMAAAANQAKMLTAPSLGPSSSALQQQRDASRPVSSSARKTRWSDASASSVSKLTPSIDQTTLPHLPMSSTPIQPLFPVFQDHQRNQLPHRLVPDIPIPSVASISSLTHQEQDNDSEQKKKKRKSSEQLDESSIRSSSEPSSSRSSSSEDSSSDSDSSCSNSSDEDKHKSEHKKSKHHRDKKKSKLDKKKKEKKEKNKRRKEKSKRKEERRTRREYRKHSSSSSSAPSSTTSSASSSSVDPAALQAMREARLQREQLEHLRASALVTDPHAATFDPRTSSSLQTFDGGKYHTGYRQWALKQ